MMTRFTCGNAGRVYDGKTGRLSGLVFASLFRLSFSFSILRRYAWSLPSLRNSHADPPVVPTRLRLLHPSISLPIASPALCRCKPQLRTPFASNKNPTTRPTTFSPWTTPPTLPPTAAQNVNQRTRSRSSSLPRSFMSPRHTRSPFRITQTTTMTTMVALPGVSVAGQVRPLSLSPTPPV